MTTKSDQQGKESRMIKMDNRMSIAHMVALFVHGAGLIWYISGVAHDVKLNTDARVKSAEVIRKVEMHDEFIKQNQGVAKEVAVINERTKHIVTAIEDIKKEIKK